MNYRLQYNLPKKDQIREISLTHSHSPTRVLTPSLKIPVKYRRQLQPPFIYLPVLGFWLIFHIYDVIFCPLRFCLNWRLSSEQTGSPNWICAPPIERWSQVIGALGVSCAVALAKQALPTHSYSVGPTRGSAGTCTWDRDGNMFCLRPDGAVWFILGRTGFSDSPVMKGLPSECFT